MAVATEDALKGSILGSPQHHHAMLERIILEKQRITIPGKVPEWLLKDSELESWMDNLAGQLLFNLNVFMAKTEKVEEHTTERVIDTVVVPLTWWDHLRLSHAPAWVLKRWPAKTCTLEIKREIKTITVSTRLCPHTVMDQDFKHIEWLAGAGLDD